MEIKTIDWTERGQIKIIDQTRLPTKLEYIYLNDIRALWKAIKIMQVRGAPALGVAAGLGVYLGMRKSCAKNFRDFSRDLNKITRYLACSRPTAKNLFWALERMRNVALANRDKSIPQIKRIIFKEAQKIIAEDRIACRKIGYFGARLFNDRDAVLTICNAGILATIDYGTALGVIYSAKEQGKKIKVFACETRPLLQGARLTTWELKKRGIDVTLICDNMAAIVIREAKVKKIVAGADRIAANGDVANKIGTYNLAVLADYHHIPFYIAAPATSFDLRIKNGRDIPIEERESNEITELFFKKPIAAKGIKVFNPAFDVTPHNLITAIITDRGIIRPSYRNNIRKILLGRS